MIRSLQQDLPLTPRPFDQWAEVAGVSTKELLAAAQSYLDRRIMRRFSAVLHHRQAGFSANAMGAWIVPADSRADFGTRAAASPAVSHCYERPTFPDWPYSIFTMVHGKSKEECEGFLADISRATGVTSYTALYSTREFKKIRVKYFTPEIEAWEKQLLGE
jgi:DNA-binding Lrp family transcriptional regulator